MTMPVYAVTGASGHVGRYAVQQLVARGVPASDIVAVVRIRSKAAGLAAVGVQVRQADYLRPETLGAALASVDRVLLVSSSQVGQLVAQHTNVITAAKAAGVSRILYTSMLNANDSTSPLAGEHRDTERVLRAAGIAVTALRNGYYTEVYTDPLGRYLSDGEILGASGDGRLSAATRQDYATAAAAALLQDEGGNRTYELGGPAFDVSELARLISDVSGTKVTHHDLRPEQYARALQQSGLDEATARFVAALDTSIARGDLQTSSQDLAHLLGHPATPPAAVVRAGYDLLKVRSTTATIGLIGVGMIGGTIARLAVDAGYHVVLSNSRGPQTLSDLASRLGPHARAATPAEAAAAGDIVVVTAPSRACRQVPAEPLAGKVVIDTTNYLPDRDGRIAELDDQSTTSSQLLQARLPASHVVKALKTMYFENLAVLARPHGTTDRSALPIAGVDQAAKQTVTAFLDAIGYNACDVGPLSEGWRFQVGAIAYAYSTDGSFDHPQPASVGQLTSLLAQAKRERDR